MYDMYVDAQRSAQAPRASPSKPDPLHIEHWLHHTRSVAELALYVPPPHHVHITGTYSSVRRRSECNLARPKKPMYVFTIQYIGPHHISEE